MRKCPRRSTRYSLHERLERTKARRVYATLLRLEWPNFTFCFHDSEEIGPAALAKIGKDTGLRPEDL